MVSLSLSLCLFSPPPRKSDEATLPSASMVVTAFILFVALCDTYYIYHYVIKVEYIPFTLTPVSINERLVYESEQLLAISTLRGNINMDLR